MMPRKKDSIEFRAWRANEFFEGKEGVIIITKEGYEWLSEDTKNRYKCTIEEYLKTNYPNIKIGIM